MGEAALLPNDTIKIRTRARHRRLLAEAGFVRVNDLPLFLSEEFELVPYLPKIEDLFSAAQLMSLRGCVAHGSGYTLVFTEGGDIWASDDQGLTLGQQEVREATLSSMLCPNGDIGSLSQLQAQDFRFNPNHLRQRGEDPDCGVEEMRA